MNKDILVKLNMTSDNNLVALTTYDRQHGRRGRFLIIEDKFSTWIVKGGEEFFDTDCGYIILGRQRDGVITLRVYWISTNSGSSISGFTQTLEIPRDKILSLIREGTPIRYVQHQDTRGKATVVTSKACVENIRRIQQDKFKLRAFKKALRDNFNWKGDVVTLYKDGRDDFCFRADGLEGGLILHTSPNRGNTAKYVYSVHT